VPTIDNKSSLTGGAIAGIVIAALLIVGTGLVYYVYPLLKGDGSKGKSSPSSSTTTTTTPSSLLDTNDINVDTNFATSNPMQVRNEKKTQRAEFEPTFSDSNV